MAEKVAEKPTGINVTKINAGPSDLIAVLGFLIWLPLKYILMAALWLFSGLFIAQYCWPLGAAILAYPFFGAIMGAKKGGGGGDKK